MSAITELYELVRRAMDPYGAATVRISEHNLDAFGRLKTSGPVTQFEYQNQYNKGHLIWNEKVTGTGVATHNPDSATVTLSTGGVGNEAGVIRQTKEFFRYTPGKSLSYLQTFTFGQDFENVRSRVGYFDGRNGVFLQRLNGVTSVGLVSTSSGSVVETIIPQDHWNIDKLNSGGPSEVLVDWTKAQIALGDVQWLGVGSIRVGIEVSGMPVSIHEFENANNVQITYMASANLPIRYEIVNIGVAGGIGTLLQICSTVITDQAAIDDAGYYTHGAGYGAAYQAVTTRRPVLSIRPKELFYGQTNRSKLLIDEISILVTTNDIYWELIYDGILGGTPSWQSAGDDATFEYDLAANSITGGQRITCGHIPASNQNKIGVSKQISGKYPMALDIDGLNPDLISLAITSMNQTANVAATATMREYY